MRNACCGLCWPLAILTKLASLMVRVRSGFSSLGGAPSVTLGVWSVAPVVETKCNARCQRTGPQVQRPFAVVNLEKNEPLCFGDADRLTAVGVRHPRPLFCLPAPAHSTAPPLRAAQRAVQRPWLAPSNLFYKDDFCLLECGRVCLGSTLGGTVVHVHNNNWRVFHTCHSARSTASSPPRLAASPGVSAPSCAASAFKNAPYCWRATSSRPALYATTAVIHGGGDSQRRPTNTP